MKVQSKVRVSKHFRRVGRKKVFVRHHIRRQLIRKALTAEYSRKPESMENDESRHNDDTLPLTMDNLRRWMANPNKYDLEGIDTVKKIRRKAREFYLGSGLLRKGYSKEDVAKARRYLREHKHLFKGSRKYIELQAEIAKAHAEGIDPEVIDFASFSSDDEKLSESLNSERQYQTANY